MNDHKEKIEYLSKCRLSLENYLEVENRFFKFANTIYVWDEWDQKKILSTLSLANLMTNICIGLEESIKLLLSNPLNDLNGEFLSYIESSPVRISRRSELIREIKTGDYSNVGLNLLLDFKNFRKLFNSFSDQILYIRPPTNITFFDMFAKNNQKPEWYKSYEDIKHNIFSKYKKATIELTIDSLGAYYLLATIVAHEASTLQVSHGNKEYFPWYEGKIEIDTNVKFATSKHWLSHFKSNEFINISVKKPK